MQDFSVEGGPQNVWGGSDFSRVDRIFTIGQSPKIWGNFSKICIKINKKLKNTEKIREKMQIFQKIFLIFGCHKFVIMGKINNLICTCCSGGFGGRSPPTLANFY